MVLSCIFLITHGFKHFPLCYLAHLTSFLLQYLFKSFAYFVYCLFVIDFFFRFLYYILDIQIQASNAINFPLSFSSLL